MLLGTPCWPNMFAMKHHVDPKMFLLAKHHLVSFLVGAITLKSLSFK
jgi:hypothetical protein